jgi:hypothetical protein
MAVDNRQLDYIEMNEFIEGVEAVRPKLRELAPEDSLLPKRNDHSFSFNEYLGYFSVGGAFAEVSITETINEDEDMLNELYSIRTKDFIDIGDDRLMHIQSYMIGYCLADENYRLLYSRTGKHTSITQPKPKSIMNDYDRFKIKVEHAEPHAEAMKERIQEDYDERNEADSNINLAFRFTKTRLKVILPIIEQIAFLNVDQEQGFKRSL